MGGHHYGVTARLSLFDFKESRGIDVYPYASNKTAVSAVQKYFTELSDKFATGQAREHAYRPVFETLIKSLEPSLKILNDPSRSEHGNPDFVFLRGSITVGYTETKDIGVDLDKTEKSDQLERYLGYSNLILTDYLEFRFFRNGQRYGEAIRIGALINEIPFCSTRII